MPHATLADGRRLFSIAAGQGAPLVLLPGLGTDHTVWGRQFPALAKHFRTYALDPRDAGRTDPAAAPYTIRDMAADVAAFIEDLGKGPALVAGWSMGGAIAQELALGWPQLVRALALVATYHEGDRRADERFHAMLHARQALPYEKYLRLSMPWAFCYQTYERPGFVEDYIQRALALPHQQPADAYARQMAATLRHHTRDRLHAIACPTLLLVGHEDILTPPERFSHAMAAEIPGSRLVEVPAAGHALLWEQPETVTEALLGFFTQV